MADIQQPATGIKAYFNEVHLGRKALGACEPAGAAPESLQLLGTESHAGPEARPQTSTLDLDAMQTTIAAGEQVHLRPARSNPPAEYAKSIALQVALGEALTGPS